MARTIFWLVCWALCSLFFEELLYQLNIVILNRTKLFLSKNFSNRIRSVALLLIGMIFIYIYDYFCKYYSVFNCIIFGIIEGVIVYLLTDKEKRE